MKYIGENAIKKLISLIKGDLATKQHTITASGLLKGDGTTISAAVAEMDYMVPPPGGTTGQILKKTETGTEWADGESFVITFSASGSGSSITYSCDKTYAEILAAYNAGYPLVASIPVYMSGKWRRFRTNDFSYKATAEFLSPARFEFSMVYKEDDPDNLDMTAVAAYLCSDDTVSIVKLPLQKKLYVSGIVKGAYSGSGGYNYSAAVAGTDYMAPATNEAQAEEGQVLTKGGDGYIWKNAPSGLPTVTTEDNGKVLRVVDGAWEAVEIANANGGSF